MAFCFFQSSITIRLLSMHHFRPDVIFCVRILVKYLMFDTNFHKLPCISDYLIVFAGFGVIYSLNWRELKIKESCYKSRRKKVR